MANLIALNSKGTNSGTNRIIFQKKVLQIGDLEFWEISGDTTYVSEIVLKYTNIWDNPNVNNKTAISDYFEGVNFIREGYSDRIISFEFLIVENFLKKDIDIIQEIQKNFSELKTKIIFLYNNEYMEIEAIKNEPIKFSLDGDFKTFSISYKTEPFFKSQTEIIKSGNINGTSGTIIEEIQGQRADVKLKLTPSGNTASGVKIGDYLLDNEINSGDIIEADFQNGKVLLNGEIKGRKGSLPLIKNKIDIPVEFLEKIIYPAYDMTYPSINGLNGESRYALRRYDYDYQTIKYRTNDIYTINYLKNIIIGCKNEFNIGIWLHIKIYDGEVNDVGNLLYEKDVNLYAGQNIENYNFEIEGEGLNTSSLNHLLIIIQVSPLTYNNSNDFIWNWKRTATDSIGTGTSYNGDNDVLNYTWNIELQGSYYPYQTSTSNISNFDYELKYFNKFI